MPHRQINLVHLNSSQAFLFRIWQKNAERWNPNVMNSINWQVDLIISLAFFSTTGFQGSSFFWFSSSIYILISLTRLARREVASECCSIACVVGSFVSNTGYTQQDASNRIFTAMLHETQEVELLDIDVISL